MGNEEIIMVYKKRICCICKSRKECYTSKWHDKYCLRCVLGDDWIFNSLIKDDRKRIKKLLKQREDERKEIELEDEITGIEDVYDEYYSQIENVIKIKEKVRYCKFCNERKETRYKIDETEHDKKYNRKVFFYNHAICIGCLGFIAGMDNQAKWARNPPPKE